MIKKRSTDYRNNKSGFRGVCYREHYGGRWVVRVQVRGRTYHVGTFDDFRTAKANRLAAETVRDILQAQKFQAEPTTSDIAEALKIGIARFLKSPVNDQAHGAAGGGNQLQTH